MKRTLLIAAALGVLTFLLVAGCSPYKTGKVKPDVTVPETYGTSDAVGISALKPPERWWTAFDDEGLDALMEEAFENNQDVSQAFQRLQRARAMAKSAGAPLEPTVSASFSAGRSRFQGFTREPFVMDDIDLTASASYELDVWKKLDSRAKSASLNALATEQDVQAILISLSAEIAEQYFNAVEKRAQIELVDKTIKVLEDNLKLVELRYREGLVDALDVYQARQNLHAFSARRATNETDLARSLNAIAVLTGRFAGEGPNIKGGLLEAPALQAPGVPSDLLTRRPDIRASAIRIEALDNSVAAAVADRYPSFSLSGTVGGSSQRLLSLLDNENIIWNILFQIVQPILDGGRRKAEVQRSEAELMEALHAYNDVLINAFREVKDALERNHYTQQYIEELNKTVEASANAHRLAMFSYQQGLTDYLPVQTAEQRLYDSQSTLITARRQLISARIELARALGGSWAERQFDELAEKKFKIKETQDER